MVLVDFGNPFLREFFLDWLGHHAWRMGRIQAELPEWIDRSAELERAAATAKGCPARPLAMTIDIDEILLCNMSENGYHDPDAGIDFHVADAFSWPRDSLLNPPLPGAQALIECAHKLGLAVFFVSGRLERIRGETIRNFEAAGFSDPRGVRGPRPADLWLAAGGPLCLCPDAADPPPGASIRAVKEHHRRSIEASHRIVANIGDQASDLGRYGDMQIFLPHPFYFTP